MGINISGLGIANAIGFKPRVDGGRPFLPPNIQSSLVSVISTYGKKNTDSDRDTLKDLTGKGNDFKLFNFSFSEASGYGEYKTDFNKNWTLEMAAITGNQIVTFNRGDYKAGVFFLKIPTSLKVNIASFTVDVDFKSSKEDAAPYYYYWDVTGKSNSDTATRNTIKNLGTAKPVASTSDEDAYSLENKNVAYEGMSGYNGYPVVFGANKTWINHRNNNNAWQSNVSQNKVIVYANDVRGGALIWSYVYIDGVVNSITVPEFKVKITGLKEGEWINYLYVSNSNSSTITIFKISENGVFTLPPSVPIEITGTPSDNKLIGFVVKLINGISENGVTIEVLPDYYGLCLDGITNYIECANIPAFTDYTYIIKYKDFDNPDPNSCIQRKGNTKLGGGAFVHSYISTENKEFQLSFGVSNGNLTNTDPIQYCTKTNYNGTIIKAGTNTDDLGITIGKWNQYRKMVFYKLMLWSKSINNTYHINMLRNLINNGGIINLNDSIFDQTSNE